ncbi:MAG: trypsin-like peptidase domain-containing protein [Candidatus Krumholzibacteria bacterium]|jgi:serine protease Do|nr:trypsin-like peptidase domain-containing protein [Candidatus Krumholzibacteria bacterium]MDP6669677.1 trypsin-like peptidase domain-containing protein [Candidatus Krumholzibacteria bacterium]MDP6797876.1 trypsin-like peptidase domain-containing protein [Candidatus Krumholzibacteria bacterium]MDP7021244.1 trypsin-like peptidase domain-containing protein [Candidatus Krumholzibacteria bacterium]
MNKERRGAGNWIPILSGFLAGLGLAAVLLSLYLNARIPVLVEDLMQPIFDEEARNRDIREGTILQEAIEKVTPAVVTVEALRREAAKPRSRFFRSREQEVLTLGSGVLVSEIGRLVTSYHIVSNAHSIKVTLEDGREYAGKLMASSPKYDIAVVELHNPGDETFPAAELGDSDQLRIGEKVLAIGSPFGTQINDPRPSVTLGVVSALHRDFSFLSDNVLFSDMIQTDAAINQGNSGGPLVDLRGQVVGITTIIFTEGGGSEGVGFARPIEDVVRILNEFNRFGKIRNSWAGFEAYEIRPQHVKYLGLKTQKGLLVTRVFAGGPGESAGLKKFDVVTAINGAEIGSRREASRILWHYEVGDLIELSVDRMGEVHELELTLVAHEESVP